MSVTTYDAWVEEINQKYIEYTEQRVVGGFREWFNRCVSENNNLREELYNLEEKNPRTKTPEVSLMMASVAKVFDEELYDEGKRTAKSRDGSGKQTRYSSGAFYKAMKLAWDNGALQIAIPHNEDKSTYYWVEVASALQKRFEIFNSLDELNVFISTACDSAINESELGIYGIYIRDINQLCLAYGILHGYSIGEYKQLLKDCKDAVTEFSGDPQQTATVDIIRCAFDKYFKDPFHDDKNDFVDTVRNNSDKILLSGGLHTQVIKYVYNRFNNLYDGIRSVDERRKEAKDESYDDYIQFDVLRMIFRQPLLEFSLKERETLTYLRKELAHRFNVLSQIDSVISNGNDWYGQFILNLRYYIIALAIKGLNDNKKSTNAVFAINYINQQLNECGFRPIDVKIEADNTNEIEMRDIFDWFIVQALKHEEIVNPKLGIPISGYRTFLKYVYNRTYQEHTA